MDRERRAGLALLLRGMSEEDAEILMAKIDGSYCELAKRLGTTSGALRVRAHRLCAELRDRAKNCGGSKIEEEVDDEDSRNEE